MVNKMFNKKIRRLLSIFCLGSLYCSQVIHADSADSLRSTSLYFKECLLDEVYRNFFNDGHVNGITAGGCNRSGMRWEVHKLYDATQTIKEKWIYLTYKDDNTPTTNIILWKFDYDKAIVLPGNERIWDVLEKYHNARLRRNMKHLKPTKEMEDIAWDQGTEAFITSLRNQIAQERKKRIAKEKERIEEQEKEENKKEEEEEKKEEERKKRDNAIKIGSLILIPTAIVAVSEIRGLMKN